MVSLYKKYSTNTVQGTCKALSVAKHVLSSSIQYSCINCFFINFICPVVEKRLHMMPDLESLDIVDQPI